MVLLAFSVFLAGSCDSVRVGCWDYLPVQCAEDVFYCWSEIPPGERPAHCYESGCLPAEWAGTELVRKLNEDCEC